MKQKPEPKLLDQGPSFESGDIGDVTQDKLTTRIHRSKSPTTEEVSAIYASAFVQMHGEQKTVSTGIDPARPGHTDRHPLANYELESEHAILFPRIDTERYLAQKPISPEVFDKSQFNKKKRAATLAFALIIGWGAGWGDAEVLHEYKRSLGNNQAAVAAIIEESASDGIKIQNLSLSDGERLGDTVRMNARAIYTTLGRCVLPYNVSLVIDKSTHNEGKEEYNIVEYHIPLHPVVGEQEIEIEPPFFRATSIEDVFRMPVYAQECAE